MPAAVNDGAWHQVVLTYNGTTLTLYIDSVALATQAATRSTVMDAYGFGIGAVINPTDANSGGFFNGSIDEVSFYTTVLSQGTVTDHYQLGTAAVDTIGPTGGSVDASGLVGTGSRYSTSTSLSLVLAKGTDPSGLAATGAELRRATATLNSGTGPAAASAAPRWSPPTRRRRRPTRWPTRPATATTTSSRTPSATPRRTPARASRSTPPHPGLPAWPSRRSPTPGGPGAVRPSTTARRRPRARSPRPRPRATPPRASRATPSRGSAPTGPRRRVPSV